MKIKAVCDITGLTDRTIRYYIEEELISPTYSENYLGRKSFDFSQEDIDTLKSISTLRKFDFTIDEIRQIINDESSSTSIISNVKQRTEASVSLGDEKLQALSKLSEQKSYTLLQLAEALSKPTITLPAPNELVRKISKKAVISFLESALKRIIIWSPIVLSLLMIIGNATENRYPVVNYKMILLTILCFIPLPILPYLKKIKWKRQELTERIFSILLFFCLPLSGIFSSMIITASETSSIYDYRKFDADCIANTDSFIQEFFPISANYYYIKSKPNDFREIAVHPDARYYYYYNPNMNSTYDIYAQWPLEQDEFDNEVTRVQDLFSKKAADSTMEYEVIRKGNYNCIILYESFYSVFEDQKLQYKFYIFAYDENRTIVRYIACVSDDPRKHQPYHLTLQW